MGNEKKTNAYDRGFYDACRGRPPLFRAPRRGIVAELDDPMFDNWTDADRAEYLRGYDAGRDQ